MGATRSQRSTCGSGRARETGDAVDGTGVAGVRGLARSHRIIIGFQACAVPVGAALAAKRPVQETTMTFFNRLHAVSCIAVQAGVPDALFTQSARLFHPQRPV
ncbi:MAG TPA: hypothetical protein DGQ94_00205 [Pseudomonas sp.]|nr:hypothetical protein [Pseudomonas sp.]